MGEKIISPFRENCCALLQTLKKLAVGGPLNWDSCQASKPTFSDIFHFKLVIGSNISACSVC